MKNKMKMVKSKNRVLEEIGIFFFVLNKNTKKFSKELCYLTIVKNQKKLQKITPKIQERKK